MRCSVDAAQIETELKPFDQTNKSFSTVDDIIDAAKAQNVTCTLNLGQNRKVEDEEGHLGEDGWLMTHNIGPLSSVPAKIQTLKITVSERVSVRTWPMSDGVTHRWCVRALSWRVRTSPCMRPPSTRHVRHTDRRFR